MLGAFSQYSTTSGTSTGSSGSRNRGLLEFASQSLLEGTEGPRFYDRLQANFQHLSVNMARFKSFSKIFYQIAMVLRLFQLITVFVVPSHDQFWSSDDATNIILKIFAIPINLGIGPRNLKYHLVITYVFALFYVANFSLHWVVILKDPKEASASNKMIFYFCISNVLICPNVLLMSAANLGVLLKTMIFYEVRSANLIVATIVAILTVSISAVAHYYGVLMIRNAACVDFKILFRPWSPYNLHVLVFDYYLILLCFLESLLDTNRPIYLLIFGIFCFVICNPYILWYLFQNPLFQNYRDSRILCNILSSGLYIQIIINIKYFAPKITPVVVSFCMILFIAFHYFVYFPLNKRFINTNLMKLYSVYKQSSGVLPPAPPLMVSGGNQSRVALTQEAFNVMQAFSSLEITTAREFQLILTIGASMHMPAVTNFDFIRWGLNFFTDKKSLLICAQICNYYHENSQTQSVILQALKSNKKLTRFEYMVVTILDNDHTDVISDQPIFYRGLKAKAMNAQARCRKCISSFWSAVLMQSIPSMKEGLCKLRNAINDAQSHFDELLRCYPYSIDAISMYISYLLENKASFIECYNFINTTSSSIIENRVENNKIMGQQSNDIINVLMKDTNNSYTEYLSNITTYAEQERRVKYKSGKPSCALLFLVIFSFIVIVTCFVCIIWATLSKQLNYPSLLEIITTGSDVIIELASLTLASRHICLYESGVLNDGMDIESTRQYLLNKSETLPQKIMMFYTTTARRRYMINILNTQAAVLDLFGENIHACLGRTIGIVTNSLRNIATNFTNYYDNTGHDDAICHSEEMKILANSIHPIHYLTTYFIDSFKDLAEKEIGEFDNTLNLILYILPASFIIFFILLLLIIRAYVISESSFRMTLYLSLPEKIASNVIHKQNQLDRKLVYYHNSSSPFFSSGRAPTKGTVTSHSQAHSSASTEKSKAMKVESLYQFTNSSKEAATTGIIGFTAWMILFFVVGALAMFVLTFYSKHVNIGFIGRCFQLCDTTRRYSSLQYVSLLIIECFNYAREDLRLFDHDTLVDWTKDILKNASKLESDLTYGSDSVPYTYKEYPEIAQLFDGQTSTMQKYEKNISDSIFSIRAPGYEYLGIESKIQLFLSVTRGILNIFSKNMSTLNISSGDWLEYNELLLNHIVMDTENTTTIYIDGANAVIERSFSVALIISIAAIVLLLLIFLGPIMYYSYQLIKYFNLTTQVLAGISPDNFRNTLYINNWLQRTITRHNFKKYEATFKRSVSQKMQSSVAAFIPEKLFLFTTTGSFLDLGSYELPPSNSPYDITAILEIFFDMKKNPSMVDSVQRGFAKFLEAKDKMENIIIKGISREGNPTRVTLHGITSADSIPLNLNEMQGFYAYVSMSVQDITVETEDERKYQAEAQNTMSLLETVIPSSLAKRIHSGETSINFSAGIGTMCILEIVNYFEIGLDGNGAKIADMMRQLRSTLGGCLSKFPNISTLFIRNGRCTFIAGLFNEEQNGKTEAEDTFKFLDSLSRAISEILVKEGSSMQWKAGVSTGGPIFCRLVMEYAPIALADGDTVSIAEKLIEMAKPGQIFFDKTTLECISDLAITPIEIGVTDVKDRKVPYYFVSVDNVLTPLSPTSTAGTV